MKKFFLKIIFLIFIMSAALYGVAFLVFSPQISVSFSDVNILISKVEMQQIKSLLKSKYTNFLPFGDEYTIKLSPIFLVENRELDYRYFIRGGVDIVSPWSFHYLSNGASSWGLVLAKKNDNSKWGLVADKLCCGRGLEWY